jgi:hypothetical protein
MKKRIALISASALLLAMIAAPVARAAIPATARDTSTSIPTMQRTVWRIWVRGLANAHHAFPTNKDFKNLRAKAGVTYTDTASGEVYGGVDLKTLVGLVDDKNPKTFNEKLATTAPGYLVNVAGADGFNYGFPSADVATKNIVVAGAVTAAGATAETGLPLGTAKYTTSKNKASFSPSWPLKLVGADLASGSQKIGGINLISLLPATTTAK